MYLVSLYFDNKAIVKIQGFINKVSAKSGKNFITHNNASPHTTIAKKLTNEDIIVWNLEDKEYFFYILT